MHKSFFSIVTVCLNAGDDLISTVNSILEQTFIDFEVIVKDGGSTDGSLERIVNDERIRIVSNIDNGIYDAMNQASKIVHGRYILFLNAGDIFSAIDVLCILNEFIVKHPDYGLYYFDYMTTGFMKRVYSPSRLSKFTLYRNMLCHQCCMFETERFTNTGAFNLEYKVIADFDYLIRFLIKEGHSSKWLNLLGVISKSGGYSSLNRELVAQEVNVLRKTSFGSLHFFYKILYAMTLPKFRGYIYSSKNKLFKGLYRGLVNIINRYF